MPEDFDDRLASLEDIARRLTGMLLAQQAMNVRIEGYMERQDALNARLTGAIERIDQTLARMLERGANGRGA